MSKRSGQCMCGAVKFTIETPERFSACFCKMCQQWASGMFMGVHTSSFEVTEGEVSVFKSSDWADRGFCGTCGSNIYYHARDYGTPSVALGTLDDTSGIENVVRYFIEKKPDGLELGGEVKSMTEAECMAHFAPDEG